MRAFMRTNKLTVALLLGVVLMLGFSMPTLHGMSLYSQALAQVTAVPGSPASAALLTAPGAQPPSWAQYVVPLVTILLPMGIAFLKKLIPTIPTVYLPWAALLVGTLSDVLNTYLTGHGAGTWWGTTAGLAAVGLRELTVQTKAAVSGDGKG